MSRTRSVARLSDRIDEAAALHSWERSLVASVRDGVGVWVQGDLPPENRLVAGGQQPTVNDFGGLDIGDPACDLRPFWNAFDGSSRSVFPAEMRVHEAMRLRGRGWAFAQALMAMPCYWKTNSGIVTQVPACHGSHVLTDE